MLNEFANWLSNKGYTTNTAIDYASRIDRLCRRENYTLDFLATNIVSILPDYENLGVNAAYGRLSHTSVKQALRRFKSFLFTKENIN